MAIIKCKMCGGDLALVEGASTAVCEFCGSVQTIPALDDEKKLIQFERAERLRKQCEFDKAAGIYETIVADFRQEAEAYWGLVLCKYGIEYVDDPATGKKIPTCHRSSFDSVMDDSNFEQAMENADEVALRVYRQEAKQIEGIRKGILAVSSNEQPYDIFICYKETDSNGDRTVDSLLAQNIYDALTERKYRVFFSRITLEDKLGQAYEPYIFAALNSAKIMLAVGTCYEHYNAVWVKNEWSRYLKIIAQDKNKYLIPCYKNIDAYDIPKEFAHLQGQDMGKVGAIQDLLRGIEKILPRTAPVTVVQEKVVVGSAGGNNKIASLLDRGNMALEDGDWAKADSFFEDVLNNDSKNAQAYIGKTLAQEKCRTIDAFVRKRKDASQNVTGQALSLEPNHAHVDEIVQNFRLPGYVDTNEIRKLYTYDLSYHSDVAERKQQYKNEEAYWANHKQLSRAEKFAVGAVAETLLQEKKHLFAQLSDRVKSAEKAEATAITKLQQAYAAHIAQADEKAEKLYNDSLTRREQNYQNWLAQAKTETNPEKLQKLAFSFDGLDEYQDSKNLAEHCRKRAGDEQAKIDAENEQKRIAQAKAAAARKKKNTVIGIVASVIVVVVTVSGVIIGGKFKTAQEEAARLEAYNAAIAYMDAGQYEEAIDAFAALGDYKDSAERVQFAENAVAEMEHTAELEASYNYAIGLLETGVSVKESEAYQILMELGDYKDAKDLVQQFKYSVISERMEILGVSNATEKVYKYNNRGLLVQKVFLNGNEDVSYTYDGDGRVIKEIKNGSYPVTECWYTDNGTRKKTVVTTSRGTIITDFDVNGSPVKVENTDTGSTWEFHYMYSESGDIDTIECFYKEGDVELTASFNLSAFGENLYLSHALENNTPVFKSISADGKDEVIFIIVYDYFKGIQLTKRFIREYDSYGNLTKETQVDGLEDAGSLCSNSYDENGNLIQVVKSYLTGMKIQYDFTYGYIYCPDTE